LALTYCWFLYTVRNHWLSYICKNQIHTSDLSLPDVTVVIIVRNEEKYIRKCVNSILSNRVDSLREIIIVNDHSEDRTVEYIDAYQDSRITLLHLADFELLESYSNKHKKAGLHYALSRCSTELVLTTDGDCMVGQYWIRSMLASYNSEVSDTMTGPIHISPSGSFLEYFQEIEMMGTMAGTLAGIQSGKYQSANAANMLFRKDDYLEFLKSYEHKNASGDDVIFVQWQHNKGKKLSFSTGFETIVITPPLANLKEFYAQRLRWASKTISYPSIGLTILMALIFVFYVSIVLFPILYIWNGNHSLLILPFVFLTLKIIGDQLLLRKVSQFFGSEYELGLKAIALSITHLGYLIGIGIAGLLIKRYTWKGRTVH